jgi:hypothetical protein
MAAEPWGPHAPEIPYVAASVLGPSLPQDMQSNNINAVAKPASVPLVFFIGFSLAIMGFSSKSTC